MRNLITCLFFIVYCSTASSQPDCSVVPDVNEIQYLGGFGLLSDFWADEVTGIDLVEKERQAMEHQLALSEVYVCDTLKDNHINLVQNIVDGSLKIYPSVAACHQSSDGKSHDTEMLARTLLGSEKHSSIVNLSMDYRLSRMNVHKKTLNRSILIQAAGNSWDNGSPSLNSSTESFSNFRDDPQVLVGAIGPDGIATEYSQEGDAVSILAPVGNFQYTSCATNPCTSTGGTSLAAPQVTYIFKAIRELLPQISKEGLIRIMNVSAIPTYHSVFEKPQQNGVGLLNAYKMWSISLRIKDSCKLSPNTTLCIKEQINNEDTYDFEIDRDLVTLFDQNFPSCGVSGFQSLSCEEKKSKFNNLRKSFLLNPKSDLLRQSLQCAYSGLGYKSNGVLYGNLSPENDNDTLRFHSRNPKALRFKSPNSRRNNFASMSFSRSYNKVVLTQLSTMGIEGLQLLLENGDRSNLDLTILDFDELSFGKNLLNMIKNKPEESVQQALNLISEHPVVTQQYFLFFKGFSRNLTPKQRAQIGKILVASPMPESRKHGYDIIFDSLRLEFDQELFNFYKNGINDDHRWTRFKVEEGIAIINERID